MAYIGIKDERWFVELDRLLENKDRLIDRLDISDIQKETAKEFFRKYPVYESKIDWNRIKDIRWEDIQSVMDESKNSKGAVKRDRKSRDRSSVRDIFKDEDMDIVHETDRWLFVRIKSYEAAVFADSKYCGHTPAKWCIGYQKERRYWDGYTVGGMSIFVLAIQKNWTDTSDEILPEQDGWCEKYMLQFRTIPYSEVTLANIKGDNFDLGKNLIRIRKTVSFSDRDVLIWTPSDYADYTYGEESVDDWEDDEDFYFDPCSVLDVSWGDIKKIFENSVAMEGSSTVEFPFDFDRFLSTVRGGDSFPGLDKKSIDSLEMRLSSDEDVPSSSIDITIHMKDGCGLEIDGTEIKKEGSCRTWLGDDDEFIGFSQPGMPDITITKGS